MFQSQQQEQESSEVHEEQSVIADRPEEELDGTAAADSGTSTSNSK